MAKKPKIDGTLDAEYTLYKTLSRTKNSFKGFRLHCAGSNDGILFVGNNSIEAFIEFFKFIKENQLNIQMQESINQYIADSEDVDLFNYIYGDEQCNCEDCRMKTDANTYQIIRCSTPKNKPCNEARKKDGVWVVEINELEDLYKLRDKYGTLNVIFSDDKNSIVIVDIEMETEDVTIK